MKPEDKHRGEEIQYLLNCLATEVKPNRIGADYDFPEKEDGFRWQFHLPGDSEPTLSGGSFKTRAAAKAELEKHLQSLKYASITAEQGWPMSSS